MYDRKDIRRENIKLKIYNLIYEKDPIEVLAITVYGSKILTTNKGWGGGA